MTKVIEFAVMNHERRSRTRVKTNFISSLPSKAPHLVLTFLYRFTQEGLNNAVRHAGGKGQTVSAGMVGQQLFVEVGDEGPGFTNGLDSQPQQALGLAGIRDRLESLGGTLEILPRSGGGSRVIARIDLSSPLASDFSRFG
jgi:signal transduction histidine kinase